MFEVDVKFFFLLDTEAFYIFSPPILPIITHNLHNRMLGNFTVPICEL